MTTSSASAKSQMKEKHEVVSKRLLEVLDLSADKGSEAAKSPASNPFVLKAIKKLRKAKGDNNLSSNDLKALNKRFMSGHLPRSKPVRDAIEHSDEDDDDDDEEDETPIYVAEKSTFLAKIINVQFRLFVVIRGYAFKYASKYGNTWVRTMIPTNQIAMFVSFLVYTYILNVEFLLYFLPLLLFLVSFIIMVVSTLRSLRGEKRFKEFLAWSDLLVSVDSALNVDEAEENYFRKHVSPVISLPPSVILCVMSYSVSSIEILPISELALGSLGFSIASFFSYLKALQKRSLIAIAIHILASFMEKCQRLSSDSDALHSWLFQVASWNVIQINLSVSVILRFAFLIVFLSIPLQERYRNLRAGIFRGMVPVVYVLVWWEMFCLFFLDSSLFGMMRAGIGAVILFASVPATLLLFIFAIMRWLFALQLLRAAIVAALFVVPVLYLRYAHDHESFSSQLNHVKRKLGPALKIVVAVFAAGLFFAAVLFYRPSGLAVDPSPLSWKNYHDICFSEDDNKVLYRRLCHQLNGHHVNWTGTVRSVDIAMIENTFESILNRLPGPLANWLTCVYGERYQSEGEKCNILKFNCLPFAAEVTQKECHLDHYNRYEFVLTVAHTLDQSPVLIRTIVSNRFRKLIFLLRPGISVNYRGLLKTDVGVVKVERLVVLEKNFKHPPRKDVDVNLGVLLDEGARAVVRFFFSPFLTFAPDSLE